MTMNVMENTSKTMGWCPSTNALAAKRVLLALPVDEEFQPGGNGKSLLNYCETGWGNKYRNYILLMSLAGAIVFGLSLLIIDNFEGGFDLEFILKGILISIILAVLIMVFEWRQLNRISQAESGLMENVFLKTLVQTTLFWAAVMLMTFTIGKDEPVVFLLILFFPYIWICYPLVVYWERKNRKTIYLVEEKLLKWRPVALPGQVQKGGSL
ncbi:MAG: DUF1673 family protein [Candidatus Methanoperedens sp.]|nr:DUF1673 family protein [Candidatus Methanoperedens sp.]